MVHKLACTAVLLASLPLAAPAASLDFFLKIDGIPGESQDVKHKDEIDVTSWSWGLSSTATTHAGGGGGSAKPVFQDFSWTQAIDRSVVPIFLDIAKGTHVRTVLLDVVRLDAYRSDSFFQLSFGDVVFDNLQLAGQETRLSAVGSLNFDHVTMRYRPQKADGSYGAWIEGGFDVSANKPLFTGDPQVLAGLALAGGGMAAAVPEPQSWALWLAGLLAGLLVTGHRLRRRRATVP